VAIDIERIDDRGAERGQERVGEGATEQSSAENASSPVGLFPLLEEHSGEEHLIIIQGTPDPDAISSALALQFLCTQHEIESNILCFASVSHHENRALVKRLGINLSRYTPDFDLSPYRSYSIVDSQRFNTPFDARLEELGIDFLAFIDHHREDTLSPPAHFVDIRPQVASTAAIMVEYLQQFFPRGLSSANAEHVRLATALMHGIRSDTLKLLLATPFDYSAAAYLSPCVDHQVLEIIERKVLTSATLDMFEKALVHRRVHDNYIIADVGFLRSADRDGIPQVAEFFLNREGTDTVLVWGIVDEKMIDGSLRTRSETINPDEFLKGFLGVSPESGRYYGGGNVRDRGGFQIPLGFFSLHDDKELIYTMSRQLIEHAFFAHIGRTGVKLNGGI
jgi:nanoRNase/pAp phosphatase (c-di-AMP/oligoRNAs hydrolase)